MYKPGCGGIRDDATAGRQNHDLETIMAPRNDHALVAHKLVCVSQSI